ncbi:ABC transporter substrate-binding protein [Candidatus Gracilibacteria bacterium]|nr:ABC transporter substrate-binding protein [Candidatus Gracilibacteria bacterium]MCF7819772.1 ABC transporter substrate-binding protein [Candidatus Gracilibacteria bacterium]
MKKLFLGLGIAFLLIGCQQQETSKNSSQGPLQIGGLAPLTGDLASLGTQTKNLGNLYAKKINAEGGIHGRNLEIIWEDGKCNPGDAAKATQKLVNIDKVSIIFGGNCSGETLGAAPITEKKEVILFSSISTSPEITKAGDFVFRNAPSDSSQGKILAEYVNENFEKVGILTQQTDYAVGVGNTFKEHFSGEFIEESFLDNESDFKTRITKLKGENLDALFINSNSPQKFEIIVKQLQEQNWSKPIFLNEISSNAESARKYSDFLTEVGTVGVNFLPPKSEELKNTLQEYTDKFGHEAPYESYLAATIDGMKIIAQVLQEVDDPNDTKAIRDALYNTQNFSGLFGTYSFDENGDVNISHQLLSFDGENFIPLQE